MPILLNKIKIKNIEDLYNIKQITTEGKISIKDKILSIYQIEPANIIACDEETKLKIYQAYISCIRGLPDTYQIMVSKQKIDFKDQINMYKERLKYIENDGLKIALKKYIEYLEEISHINKLYKTNHYLIVENLNNSESNEIVNIFSNLKEFGVRINRIKSKEKIENLLRRLITKEMEE